MAFDLSLGTAWKAAHAVGATPAPNYPGGDDAWVVEWFKNGVNSGDARLLKFADPNATVAEGHGEKDLIADWRDAAPSSEWLGKRKPTARELRRYAMEEMGGNYLGEDFARWGDRTLADAISKSWDPSRGGFFTQGGTQVAKPWDQSHGDWVQGWEPGGQYRGAGGFGAGGGYGGRGWGGGSIGGRAPVFTPPTYESVWQDPGFQFELKQGQTALQGSQAAQGLLRTGGSVADLLKYSQGLAATRYGDAYNRGLQQWQTQYQPWAQQGNWNLSQWTTQQQADLQKYLQREGEIYGLYGGATPPPTMPGTPA